MSLNLSNKVMSCKIKKSNELIFFKKVACDLGHVNSTRGHRALLEHSPEVSMVACNRHRLSSEKVALHDTGLPELCSDAKLHNLALSE